jgi:N-acetylglucosaminyldiphosphoundecaprenol N-acetyl-beta-D-mannosaminyltransferase
MEGELASGEAIPFVEILGVRVHRVDVEGMLQQIEEWVEAAQDSRLAGVSPSASAGSPCRQICTVNPEFVMEARRNPAFAAVLCRADLRVPDGVGILWAARLLGQPVPERVTGSDGIHHICARASRRGWRVYLLGAAPGVAERAATLLEQRYPGLQVAGAYGGNPHDASWPPIRRRLEIACPDILFVAYGHPRQDLWIDRHRDELPVRVAIGVGGAFDFVAGTAMRAPLWLQRLGLEWLHRLVKQPWRWRRMLALPRFVLLVLDQRRPERCP